MTVTPLVNFIQFTFILWIVFIFFVALAFSLILHIKREGHATTSREKRTFTEQEYNVLYLQHYHPNLYYGR